MSSADVGDWYTMYEGVQVQASHRQSSDAEWYVTPSDWKLQLWIKQNDIYFSSYINNDEMSWTTTFFYEGEERSMGHWYFEPSMDYFKSMSSAEEWTWKGEEGVAEWNEESDDDSDDSDTEEKLRVAQDMIDIFCENEDEHSGEEHDMMDGDMMHHDKMEHDMMDHDEMDHDDHMDHDEMDHDRKLMHHKKDDKKMSHKKSHKKTKDDWLCEEAHHIYNELDEYHHSDQRGKEKKAHSWMKDLEGEIENIWDAATTI